MKSNMLVAHVCAVINSVFRVDKDDNDQEYKMVRQLFNVVPNMFAIIARYRAMKGLFLMCMIAFFMVPRLNAQCPNQTDFNNAVAAWTEGGIINLITMMNNLPGWHLIYGAESYGLNGSTDIGSPIASDEVLEFTVRHWGNSCINTGLTAQIVLGNGLLTAGIAIVGNGYTDQPYTFGPSGNGQVSIDFTLEDDLQSTIKQSLLTFNVIKLYNLTVNLGTGTTGLPGSSQTYEEQTDVLYMYTSESCFENLETTTDGNLVSNSGTLTMDQNHVLATTADIKTYQVIVASTTGGTTDQDGSNTVNCGESLTILANPNTGYTFSAWSGDATGSANPLTLNDVTSGMNVTANFTIMTHNVTIISGSGGSTDKTGLNIVNHGESLTITATPNTGYTFMGWSGDTTGITNPLTLSNITSGMNITASFATNQVDDILGNLMAVAAGTFTQGSPSTEPCREQYITGSETQFTHTLTRSMLVMETEVSRQMWADLKAVQVSLPSDPTDLTKGSGMNNPVQNNTWFEALLFANLLSLEQGLTRCYYKDASYLTPLDANNYTSGSFYCDFDANGFRLPSEGEWEYFTRAGSTGTFSVDEPNYTAVNCSISSTSVGTWPSLESVAWLRANKSDPAGNNVSKPVGLKGANPWGLKDVHGNVWEMCWDWYSPSYPTGSATDYTGISSGFYRVYRGGDWNTNARGVRSANRDGESAGTRGFYLGFRLLRNYH